MRKRIQELLNDLAIVNATLNSAKFDENTVASMIVNRRAKAIIEAELKLYTAEEISAAKKTQRQERTPQLVEEEELIKTDDRGMLYYILLFYILDGKSDNKLFLLIALNTFFDGEKIERRITTTIK